MNTKTLGIMIFASALGACGSADSDTSTDSLGGLQTNQSTTSSNNSTTGGGNNATPTDVNQTTNNTATETTGETVVDVVPTGAGFAGVFDLLIAEGGCSAGYCHGNAVATADSMYDFLVNQAGKAETTCDATLLVSPGDPDASILWLRVRPISMDDGEPCAAKMPRGSTTGMSDETATVVYEWILDGAQR